MARWIRPRTRFAIAATAMIMMSTGCAGDEPGAESPGSVTQGPAIRNEANLLDCSYVPDARISRTGRVRSGDGKEWTVPAEVNWFGSPRLADLYNDCTGVHKASTRDFDIKNVPIREIDLTGKIITGYLFGDNYFELYVNGTLVGVDPVPYAPFNASVVRFRAKPPVTYAIKLVDWEENLGVGTERLGTNAHHPGDGGFIASFSDGTVTDDTWRAQSFYIAPLSSPDEVVERGSVHHTSARGNYYPLAAPNADCADRCYAVHYPIAQDWADPSFNDAVWPAAVEFTEAQVSASQPAFQSFRPQLTKGGAAFIWTSNLVLDNVVLARKTTPSPN